jgi:branched-chain amino acid transport system permease protein
MAARMAIRLIHEERTNMFVAIDTLLQGLMLGALYALFALGLSLMFGVMRVVNTAHGDFVILAAFLIIAIVEWSGWNSFLSLAVALPAFVALGYCLQRTLINPLVGRDALPSIVVTFGLSVVIQNVLLQIFSADTRSIPAYGLESGSLPIAGDLAIGTLPATIMVTALASTAGFSWMMQRTRLGKSFRAVSDDPEAAALMGINARHVFGIATGLALGLLSLAGLLVGMRTSIAPSDGPALLIYGFESVVVGGLGSFWGTFTGALVIGIAQSLGSRINPGWGPLAGHLLFLAILVVKPQGLFFKKK